MAKIEIMTLIADLEHLFRTMPSLDEIIRGDTDALLWLGEARGSLMSAPSASEKMAAMKFSSASDSLLNIIDHRLAHNYYMTMQVTFREVLHVIKLSAVGPKNVSVDQSSPFEYFNHIRKIVAEAKEDVFFIDPYLEANFVETYLPCISSGTAIRLLTERKIGILLPAVTKFVEQEGANVELRKSADIHDRFVFVDRSTCYQSGTSFKDGARNAPTLIVQITDALGAMLSTYEDIWEKAERINMA